MTRKPKPSHRQTKSAPHLLITANETWETTITRARKCSNLSRRDFATLLLRSERTIEAWEQGRYFPNFWKRSQLIDAVNAYLGASDRKRRAILSSR